MCTNAHNGVLQSTVRSIGRYADDWPVVTVGVVNESCREPFERSTPRPLLCLR